MILFKKASELSKYLKIKSEKGVPVGFLPTMGALHAGHLSLLEHARANGGLSVASIFVNPTQFNDPQDFAKYPVTIDTDILALEKAGCDVLFLPSVGEIYPGGTSGLPRYDLGHLETIWEGRYRPGHFQGVCQVMDRLLSIVIPDQLYMGRKDYQQCMVIRRLIELKGWSTDLRIVPTMRESSGLAMSSRNARLTEEQKQRAVAIYESLQMLYNELTPGDTTALCNKATDRLLNAGFSKADYVGIADAVTLAPVTEWDGAEPVVALAAAFIGGVRLIDNMALSQ